MPLEDSTAPDVQAALAALARSDCPAALGHLVDALERVPDRDLPDVLRLMEGLCRWLGFDHPASARARRVRRAHSAMQQNLDAARARRRR